jgi:putative ABC transport system permease protein
MEVVGVLERTYTPDDDVVFVDLKTSWIIEGLGHGHQDLAKPEAASGVLKREGDKVIANASVVQYNEITDENLDSFHFHGQDEEFPVTAIIAVPFDDKSATLLQGRYLSQEELVQIVQPVAVMGDLLSTILTVQSYVVAAVVIVGIATLATASLVFMLSLRLRRREIQTMTKIGGSSGRILGVLASEIIGVLILGILLAGGLTVLTSRFGADIIRRLILS